MRGGRSRARVVFLALIGAAVAVAVPASAAGQTRVEQIARALERDPVYVSDSLARAAGARDVAQLRRDVAAMPVPTFVVIAPQFSDDPELAAWEDLIPRLHDRLDRDGLYVALTDAGFPDVERFGARGVPSFELEMTAYDVDREEGLAARASRILAAQRGGEGAGGADLSEGLRTALPWVVFALAGVAVFGGLTLHWRDRPALLGGPRRGDALRPAPLDPEPSLEEARGHARRALAELQRAVARAKAPSEEVFAGYRAASKATDDARHPVDAVGAQALAEAARRRLEGQEPRPCFFNPHHGAGPDRVRFVRGGVDVELPACGRCARALGRGRAPEGLADRGRPYWERDTLWARTGFGAVDEELPARVLAGEAR